MANKTNFFNKHKKDILIYSGLFLMMIVLNRATIVDAIKPFGFSFIFALVYLEKNAFILAPCYLISYLIFDFSLSGIIATISTISLLILLYLIFKLIKKKVNLVCTLVFALISQVGYVYFHLNSASELIITLVMLVVGLLFIYVCMVAFGAIFYRGLQSRFTLDETLCFSIFLIASFAGLSNIYICNINITNAIVFILLLLTSRTLTKMTTICLSVLAGFGVAFATSGVSYIAIFVCWGIICALFSGKTRVEAPLGMIIVDLVLGLFLNAYAYYSYLSIIPLAVSGVIYLALPDKFYQKLAGYSYRYDGNLTNEYIIAGQQNMIKQKLYKMSELFKQMQVCYRNLSVGEIDRQGAAEVLAEELIKKHCFSCPKYNECLENLKIKESINQLFAFGIEKGKVTIIDANNLITVSCFSLSGMINEINQSIANYFEYEKQIKTQDNGKMLISEQMGGTGDLLSELASLTIAGQTINEKMGKELLDELILNKVVANEVVVLDGEYGIEKIVIIVRNSDVLSPNILYSIRSIFRLEFINITTKMTRLAGWSIMVFVPAPKYSVSIGFASTSQSSDKLSGDTYSLTKISETKTLIAISDGMGHGKRANEISSVALSLIENFYRAGFSSQTIISSVNKIMLPSGEENFTTLDACVIDTSNGTADFVKIGATASVIKSKDTCKTITTDSLPLGIVGLIAPVSQKCILKSGDIIVLASDGVVDCFDNLEDFQCYVNNERVINVQMLADNILEEAESRTNKHIDDKTVITIKVNQNLKTN